MCARGSLVNDNGEVSEESHGTYAKRVADPSSPRYAVHHAGLPRKERRESVIGSAIGEFFGEIAMYVLAAALFAGLSAAVVYGWNHNKPLMIVTSVAALSFLAYGLTHLIRAVRGSGGGPRWPRIAAQQVSPCWSLRSGLHTS